MFLKSKFLYAVSILMIVLGLSVFAFADLIRLKDGSVIKGKIISFDNNQFVILIGAGVRQRQLRFYSDEIESIKFDKDAVQAVVRTTKTRTTVAKSQPKQPKYTTASNAGNSKVITVGNSSITKSPQSNNSTSSSTKSPTSSTRRSSSLSKPIMIERKVLADNTSNGWTNAGWVVRKGQKIRIRSNGRVSLGNGRYSGPNGITTLPDAGKLIKNRPTGSLIAVIGDDNNDFIFIGNDLEFVAKRDGSLFLGINEGNLRDNSGAYRVTIEIATTIGN